MLLKNSEFYASYLNHFSQPDTIIPDPYKASDIKHGIVMKKKIRRLTSEDLSDYPITDLVDGWCFKIEEVSLGGYLVEGKDPWGKVVSRMGADPDILVNACRNDIKEMFPKLKT